MPVLTFPTFKRRQSGAAGLEGGHTASPSAVANTLNWFNVNAGGFHTCGIRRYFNRSKHTLSTFDEFDHVNPDDAPGQMRCWGMNDYGQVHPIPLPLGEPPTEDTKDAYGRSNVACTRASESPRRIGKKGVNDGLPGDVVHTASWHWELNGRRRRESAGRSLLMLGQRLTGGLTGSRQLGAKEGEDT